MERVELNLHTNMSQMSGIANIRDYINRAKELEMTSLAITDNEVVQAFPQAHKLLSDNNPKMKIIYGMESNIEFENNKIYTATILVKDKIGLKNLYELVSLSYLKYYNDKPVIPFNIYKEYAGGLIIGACFNNGELYNAIINDVPDVELKNIASKYDYLEICPVNENKRDILKKIIDIGNKANKTVVATGNVYYLEKEDEIYRKIIREANGFEDAEIQPPLYFRTTEEMLKEFNYLDEETAYEVVVTNTNKVADMCEQISPISSEKCYPYIENCNEQIKELAYKSAYKIYGNPLSKNVEERLNKELKTIIENDFATIYLIAQKLVEMANNDGYIVGNRGSIGSSFVAYCLGITETDPLKYDIPFETFVGIDEDREPNIALCLPHNYKKQLEKCIDDKYLEKKIFEIYESNIPSILFRLKELTGIDPTSIPLDDEETLNMICSADTLGIPEFETELARNIILEIHPNTFDDLVKIFGLSHGTDVWENNAQDLIKNGTATLSEVITTRDDIFNYLVSIGVADETAFKIMEFVRKGRARKENWQDEWKKFVRIMQEHNVPNWYIKSCEKISYLFPKAHSVGYVINYYRIGWYKAHYPQEFEEVMKEFKE